MLRMHALLVDFVRVVQLPLLSSIRIILHYAIPVSSMAWEPRGPWNEFETKHKGGVLQCHYQAFAMGCHWSFHGSGSCHTNVSRIALSSSTHHLGGGGYRKLHSQNIGADCGKLLVVGASNDGFYFKSKDAKSGFMKEIKGHFQDDFVYHEVEGGNHSGFADYTAQTFSVVDGPRDMPLEQQHKELVGLTRDFLLKPKETKEGEQKLTS
mmetsp:Transcript_23958/g.37013  ORF Transcript_23958/g.37013 Transcript_23958/m.37013 type:complete len:209 (+) Transcript_23958:1703-2329(+)